MSSEALVRQDLINIIIIIIIIIIITVENFV